MSDLVGNPEDRFSHNEAQMPSKDADGIANSEDPDEELSDLHCLPRPVCLKT